MARRGKAKSGKLLIRKEVLKALRTKQLGQVVGGTDLVRSSGGPTVKHSDGASLDSSTG